MTSLSLPARQAEPGHKRTLAAPKDKGVNVPSQPTRSSQLIGEVIALGPAPLLKAMGFRKKGTHFFKTIADTTCHLSFQSSQWNAPEFSKFTLNLWTYLPAIAISNGDALIVEPEKQKFGHCGVRIGHLFPEPGDNWWQISDPSEVPTRAAEVRLAVENYAIPYLVRAASLEGIAELSGHIPGVGTLPTHFKAHALRLLGRERKAAAVEHELEVQSKKPATET